MNDKKTSFKIDATINSELRKRTRRHFLSLGLLNCDWPDSVEAVREIYKFLSTAIHTNEEPVFYRILTKALDEYSAVLHHTNNAKYPDPVRLGIFLSVLIGEASKALEIRVSTQSGDVWTPDNEQSLGDWLREREDEPLTITPCPHEDNGSLMRERLYELITSDGLKTTLRRARYEQAVLDGRMDCAYPVGGGLTACTG